ncbi:MAG: hypothetical protein VX755_08690, partial [Pseudomonadota bacterium]|nr:hypothetical protein [Pseudomonadota bacterium]
MEFAAVYGFGDTAPVYAGFIQAEADIRFGPEGSVALPLAVRIPTNLGGWTVGLAPGRAVPISDLALFLGQFTGLSLLSALPAQVQVLSRLALTQFAVQLSPDRTDFTLVELGLASIAGDEGQNCWTIIPGASGAPILALEAIGFNLTIARSGGTCVYTGAITGSFALSQTIKIQARALLPLGQGLITVTARSDAPLPDLGDLARFLGGQALADLLPRSLGTMTRYILDELTFLYDPAANALKRITFGLSAAGAWTLVTDWVVLDNVSFRVALADPLGGSSPPTGTITGTLLLGTAITLHIQVQRVAPSDPWRLSVDLDPVTLPSLNDLAKLAGGDVAALLPETLANNHFTLSDLALDVDVSAGRMERFGFQLETTDTWTIITDILAVTNAGVLLNLDWTGEGGQHAATGAIWGNVLFCGAAFSLSAVKTTDTWTLSAALLDGAQLTLQALADAVQTGLWTRLQGLGVPNIALTAAQIGYDTKSGDYDFSGSVGPAAGSTWTIPIGLASISITSLGAAVSCHRAADGTASDKKVHVTGAFSVGAASFQADYLAGDNLTIACQLVGDAPVAVKDLVTHLCDADAGGVSWTSGFASLDQISLSSVQASLILGDAPSFQMSGRLSVEGVEVAALVIVKQVASKWEFALAIEIDAQWRLSGFTDAFSAFNIDKATWMVVASSFSAPNFQFPPSFPTPPIVQLERGLDFYGAFSTSNTLSTISGVKTVLPAGVVGASLTVHGLLTDPLNQSYLEVILVSSAEGVPLMDWGDIRLAAFSLRLTAEPAFGLHGDFILGTIKNPDGSKFHLILDLKVSATEVQIVFQQQPDFGAIFTWDAAFGIPALSVSLTDLDIGILFEGPMFDGTVGGKVTFEHQSNPTNSVMKNVPPAPHVVRAMERARPLKARVQPELYGAHLTLDYARAYDIDGILIEMRVSFVIPAEEPVP